MTQKKFSCNAVFFDLWDTLVSARAITWETQQEMGLGNNSFRFFIQRFERAVMLKRFVSVESFVRAGFAEFGLHPEKEKVKKIASMWRAHMKSTKLFPETLRVLKALKQKGFLLALVSNCQFFGTRAMLKRLKLLRLFDSIQLSFENGLLKPNPRVFSRALKALRLKPKQAIMVGDSRTDIIGAANAKMRGIIVQRKLRSKKYFKAVAAIGSLEELFSLLERG